MTFDQYIENPMGKHNAVFSQRESYRANYTTKYDQLMVRENGAFVYHLFYDKSKDEYYCYIKIPSEGVKGFFYDVVIQFYTKDNVLRTAPALEKYDVRFFSNDPAFVYTYAHVFYKEGMFIEVLKSKASKVSLKQAPNERNYYQTPGYVKSIYFAYLYMKSRNLFQKNTYHAAGAKYSRPALVNLVTDTDTKLAERDDAGKLAAAQRKVEREKQKIIKSDADKARMAGSKIGRVRNVPEVSGTSITSPIRNTRKVSTVRKIPKR